MSYMKYEPLGIERSKPDSRVDRLAQAASELGYKIVDIAGFLALVDGEMSTQLSSVTAAEQGASQVRSANDGVTRAANQIAASAARALGIVDGSMAVVRHAGERSRELAEFVTTLNDRAVDARKIAASVSKSNREITDIAAQVNILAINAKIEAARAGDAGRGFAVVADAINELSRRTQETADAVGTSIELLTKWINETGTAAGTASVGAKDIISGAEGIDRTLLEIDHAVRAAHDDAGQITSMAQAVNEAVIAVVPALSQIGAGVRQITGQVSNANKKTTMLIDQSEILVQESVALGGASQDARFITYVKDAARRISLIFEDALARGAITPQDLFDQTYTPVAGTNPQQVLTRVTPFTDRVLPAIQEEALRFDPKVVFCAAVDTNGYLPTHNQKFSAPQRSDPVWNAANCRNRRIFNDRVGLKAGRNRQEFLLQVYRRDMGGGQFTIMKDLSAPIIVQGRQWGGLRLAYTF